METPNFLQETRISLEMNLRLNTKSWSYKILEPQSCKARDNNHSHAHTHEALEQKEGYYTQGSAGSKLPWSVCGVVPGHLSLPLKCL